MTACEVRTASSLLDKGDEMLVDSFSIEGCNINRVSLRSGFSHNPRAADNQSSSFCQRSPSNMESKDNDPLRGQETPVIPVLSVLQGSTSPAALRHECQRQQRER